MSSLSEKFIRSCENDYGGAYGKDVPGLKSISNRINTFLTNLRMVGLSEINKLYVAVPEQDIRGLDIQMTDLMVL